MSLSTFRRLRFGLRSLLLLLTLTVVWIGWHAELARRQRTGVAWVRDYGGHVIYDYEKWSGPGPRPWNMSPPGPQWLRELVGIDYFATVESVILDHNEITDLAPMAAFSDLQTLALIAAVNAEVDLSVLGQLTKLKELRLDYTGIDAKRLESLKEALPNCRITSATDPDIVWSPQ